MGALQRAKHIHAPFILTLLITAAVALMILIAATSLGWAGEQPPTTPQAPAMGGDTGIYEASFKILFGFFVLALLLEAGLALIYSWRPFLVIFDQRGVKTVISFVVAMIFVNVFNMDIVTRLVEVYSGTKQLPNTAGPILTAMILAGGSGGVHKLMTALGLRNLPQLQAATPKPPPTDAWLAVKLLRKFVDGPVQVEMDQGNGFRTAGTIHGTASRSGFMTYFLRDQGRFPTSGGHTITPGTEYKIRLTGTKRDGTVLTSTVATVTAMTGAIIDIDLTL